MDRGRRGARRLGSLAAALLLHALVLMAVVQMTPQIRQRFVTPAVPVTMLPQIRPAPPKPPPPPKPEPETHAPAPRAAARKTAPPPPAAAAPPRAHLVQAPDASPSPPRATAVAAASAPALSDSEIAGALTAASGDGAGAGGGQGGPGQGCNMIRRLQRALRSDRQVQAAIARAQAPGGRPLIVWRGDWIQSSGEAGKGLAGLRQAIAMEVAFAPEACRAEPVRGVVLLSLSDAPGGARIALGGGVWRWSDLLFARAVGRR